MKVSVVVPSFNQGTFIGRTLESLFTQAGDFDLEVFVEDGGSNDTTISVLTEYSERAKGYPRLAYHWVSEKDRGQSHAINKGLKKATGDVLAYLNSDDEYAPGALKTVTQHFENNPDCNWCYGRLSIIDATNKEVSSLVTLYREILGRSYSYRKLLVLNFIPQPATFWTRSLWDKIGPFDEKHHLAMDYEYWLRAGKYFDATPLSTHAARFRVHGESKGCTQHIKQFEQALQIAGKYSESSILLWAHRIHDWCTVQAYRVLR
jgi:glycosyltransferase involved in cell wall biosynthesis